MAGACFVAADLGDVGVDAVGEGLLGEAAVFACGYESVCEVHGHQWVEGCVHVMDVLPVRQA